MLLLTFLTSGILMESVDERKAQLFKCTEWKKIPINTIKRWDQPAVSCWALTRLRTFHTGKRHKTAICRLPACFAAHVLAQCQCAGWCRGQRSNDKKSNFTLEIEFVTAVSGPWDGTLVNISLPVLTVATPRSTNQEPAENQKKRRKEFISGRSLVNRHRVGTVPQPINEILIKAGK